MKTTNLLAFAFALVALPAFAQTPAAPAEPAPPVSEGIEVTVSDDAEWQDLGVAITTFATDQDVPTRASAGSTAQIGRQMSEIIAANLRNNGLFKPSGPQGLPQPGYAQVPSPDYPVWQGRSADMLVQGYVRAAPDGNLTVGCYLFDVALSQQLAKAGWDVSPGDWRRAAHKCADMVYSRLSGESPFFDSKVAYIAETGPKDRRVNRLRRGAHRGSGNADARDPRPPRPGSGTSSSSSTIRMSPILPRLAPTGSIGWSWNCLEWSNRCHVLGEPVTMGTFRKDA